MERDANLYRKHILVVEDESFQRRVLRQALKNIGFRRVEEVDSGSTAIAVLESQPIDLVLSDVDMPGMNGLDLLRLVRAGQTPVARDTRFIIFTSYSDTEVLGAAMALDINGFVVKPFKVNVILDKISRAFNEQMILRSKTEYRSVTTDIASLHPMRRPVADNTAPAVTENRVKNVSISELRTGMRVAKNVKGKTDNTIVVAADTVLTEIIIKLLSDLKELLADEIVTVYDVYDPRVIEQ